MRVKPEKSYTPVVQHLQSPVGDREWVAEPHDLRRQNHRLELPHQLVELDHVRDLYGKAASLNEDRECQYLHKGPLARGSGGIEREHSNEEYGVDEERTDAHEHLQREVHLPRRPNQRFQQLLELDDEVQNGNEDTKQTCGHVHPEHRLLPGLRVGKHQHHDHDGDESRCEGCDEDDEVDRRSNGREVVHAGRRRRDGDGGGVDGGGGIHGELIDCEARVELLGYEGGRRKVAKRRETPQRCQEEAPQILTARGALSL